MKDVGFFTGEFGTSDCTQSGGCDSDFDGNGTIDGADLVYIASEYGKNECDLWGSGTVVYVVDDPPAGSPVHFRELTEAAQYLPYRIDDVRKALPGKCYSDYPLSNTDIFGLSPAETA